MVKVDRGVLPLEGAGATCGLCRNVRVRRVPLTREEGRRWGWRYTDVLGWVCPTCGLGDPGVATLERKRRARPRRVSAPERPAAPTSTDTVRGFRPRTVREIMAQLKGDPAPEP